MANAELDREIRARIDRFLEELTALVKRSALESVSAALGAGAPGGAARRGRPRKSAGPATARRAPAARKARGGKRTGAQMERQTRDLQAFISSHPGLRLEQMGQQLGQPTKELRGPLTRLMEQGAVRSEGQRRGMRYFPGGGARKAAGAGRKAKKKARRKSTKKKTARKTAAA